MPETPVAQRPCSVARTLEVLGDRWALLILREAFFGVRRFDQFQGNLGIARNILTRRLKHLVEHGILEKRQYLEHPPRYEYQLTAQGLDLYDIVLGLIQWGDRWLDGGKGPPLALKHRPCGHPLQPVMTCGHCGEKVRASEVDYEPGPGAE